MFEVVVEDEARNVWSIYLEKEKFQLALEHVRTPEQKELVLGRHADSLFRKQSFEAAAELYAETKRSFEEVALRFVNVQARGALKVPRRSVVRPLSRAKPNDNDDDNDNLELFDDGINHAIRFLETVIQRAWPCRVEGLQAGM